VKLLHHHDQTDQEAAQTTTLLVDDTKFASGKVAFFQYLSVAVFVFLGASFWDLQVQNPELYSEAALRNSVKSIPLLAARGKILDRDGRIIVDNHPSYSVLINRQLFKPEHLPAIASGLNMDPEDLAGRLRRFASEPKYRPLIIKQELTKAELSFIDAHRDASTFPELELIHVDRRLYPKDGIAAHVIGYVGEVSEPDLDTPEFAKYTQGDIVGKAGIERQYNDLLIGTDGQRQEIVDNLGRSRGVIGLKDAIPGKSLQLTIDLDLQAVAELALDDRRGAVVALDPRTGEVLAMVSRPSYDPNMFAAGHINKSDWKDIVTNPYHPLLNRAIQAQLAPGSTLKPIIALAGLETGAIDDNFRVNCAGGASFYGHYHHCHLKRGHGTVDLHRGLAQSCDVFFYNVGDRTGIDHLAEYAQMAGLGHRTGIDLPQEAEGLFPSSKWKARALRQKWFAGDTISVAIGQGYVTVTPLQLAAAIGGLATGGVWMKPHLLQEAKVETAHKGEQLSIDNINKIVYGMWAVVNEGGTGRSAMLPGLDVCGKTGTAQLASNELLKGTKIGETMKDNAWFVGFAPRQAPEIVVVALFENGEHGDRAAPIVRDVIKAYFDKKARIQKFQVAQSAGPQSVGILQRPEIPSEAPKSKAEPDIE
jgi:penicillin-binding protein 2